MRAIRQSDIEIAKAEVAILRSLGMEPDKDALLLSQLERPPATEVFSAEPIIELNGQSVEVAPIMTGSALADAASRTGHEAAEATRDDEIDIALVVPPSDDPTMMYLRIENLHGGAQDVVGTMELAQVDEHFVYSKGVRLGRHSKVETSSTAAGAPDLENVSATFDAKAGSLSDKVVGVVPQKVADLVAAAAPALSHMVFRVGRSITGD